MRYCSVVKVGLTSSLTKALLENITDEKKLTKIMEEIIEEQLR